MTRISVVVPVKNDARELDLCLLAITGQTISALEIIVVDNDSSDDSALVARRHGAIVIPERKRGIWAAAATGFDHASGDVIARCDADSRPDDDWLERIAIELDAHPEAVAITGPGRFYELGPVRRVLADIFYMRAYFVLAHGALAHRPLFGSNFAIRTDVWRDVSARVHRDDPDVHDDFDLSYHLDPCSTVLVDRRLQVGISSRPFSGAASMLVRTRRAMHTVAVHGVGEHPIHRWRRRLVRSVRP
ncbi:glycosyltransferase family 2 protein [Marisediminicola antarctica]|uniref:glycosyltransferase family 2 protein n=1 Tax=Marisediminicola antarctica TaxID=674079 RepID=UPI00192A398C|nr:glycosyltransferase family 2 protein [Marisediminicola antarctica]